MKSIVKHGGLWILVAGLSFVVVSDVQAWPFRRRYRSNSSGYNNYSSGYNNSGYNTNSGYTTNSGYNSGYGANYGYSTQPAMPDASVNAPGADVYVAPTCAGAGAAVSAPGVGVNAGSGGAAISAPGVGVNAGPNGASVSGPGVGINAGPAGVGADANARVRGQSPDVTPPPAP